MGGSGDGPSADEMRAKLRSFISSTFLPDEPLSALKDSTMLVTTGIITSLGALEVVAFIEDRFKVKLQGADLERLNTIDEIVEVIQQRTQGT